MTLDSFNEKQFEFDFEIYPQNHTQNQNSEKTEKSEKIIKDEKKKESHQKDLSKHFAVKIDEKNKRISTIEQKVKNVELQWQKLQKMWSTKSFDEEINGIVSTVGVSGNDADEIVGEKKEKKEPKLLFARRPNGQFVQMICPVCGNSHFITLVGFLNHCRIIHKLKFSTFEDATMNCGRVVDENVIPADDPVRLEKNLVHYVHEKKTKYMTGSISSSNSVSRFYVKKRIICGNVSQRIAPDSFPVTGPTHKWMIYARSPDHDTDDISRYLKKVRFFLHPSFAPSDLVEVHSPPFQITRMGWGEFPIRIQLHFVDPKNKPINIIHQLKLDRETPGLPCLGSETSVDVELDRQFFELGIHSDELAGARAPIVRKLDNEEIDESMYSYRDITEFLTQEAKDNFPLISKEKLGTLPYTCAVDFDEWFDWSHGKRKASEWQRARRLSIALKEVFGIHRSTGRILAWCVREGLTPFHPPPKDYDDLYREQLIKESKEKMRTNNIQIMINEIRFCRYCGSVHFPFTKTQSNENNCFSQKRRKLDSYTRVDINSFMGLPQAQIIHHTPSLDVCDLTNDNTKWIRPKVNTVTPISIVTPPRITPTPINISGFSPITPVKTPIDTRKKKASDFLNESISDPNDFYAPTYSHAITVGNINQDFVPQVKKIEKPITAEVSPTEKLNYIRKYEESLWLRNLLKDIDVDISANVPVVMALTKITELFAKELIKETYTTAQSDPKSEHTDYKLIVPYHVFESCQHDPKFDIITNIGLGYQ